MNVYLWAALGLVLCAVGVEWWLLRQERKRRRLEALEVIGGALRGTVEGPRGEVIELRRRA